MCFMIERELDKESFDSLSGDDKKLYQQSEEGKYVFMGENPGELRRANERLKRKDQEARQRLDQYQKKQAELEDKLAAFAEEKEMEKDVDARKKGDVEKLEASHKLKVDRLNEKWQKKISGYEKFINDNVLEVKAHNIAQNISSSPALMIPHIKGRMRMDTSGDMPELQIADSTGQYGVISEEDLQDEFKNNKMFAAVLKSSNQSQGVTSPVQSNTSFGQVSRESAKPDEPKKGFSVPDGTQPFMPRTPTTRVPEQQQQAPTTDFRRTADGSLPPAPVLHGKYSDLTVEEKLAYNKAVLASKGIS